ncbi:MAG TPA: tetratricopeptide repeat protein [Chroococcales cyanobacterium]
MWERHNVSGQQLQTQGRSQEAEVQFRLAIQEAEKFGPHDAKLAMSLLNLANCLRGQGKFADAEATYKRAIEVKEKGVGPLHNDLVQYFENYAKMLRAAGREAEANKMQSKAQAIFARK